MQRAVKANPKSLSFLGLEKMCDHGLDEGQGLAAQDFTKHFSEISEADARIMKQQRLLRGELAAQGPGGSGAVQDPDEEDPPPRRRRPKAKAKGKAKG